MVFILDRGLYERKECFCFRQTSRHTVQPGFWYRGNGKEKSFMAYSVWQEIVELLHKKERKATYLDLMMEWCMDINLW